MVYSEFNEVRKYSSSFHKKASFKNPKYAIKKFVFKSTFSFLEFFLPYYDGLICISTAIETYGKKFNPSTIRIPILTNPNVKNEFSNEVFNKKDSFNIGFSGSIQPDKENLINFFKVLGNLKKSNYNFTLNLCGIIKKEHQNLLLEKLASELNIKDSIKYYGNLDSRELSTFLNSKLIYLLPYNR